MIEFLVITGIVIIIQIVIIVFLFSNIVLDIEECDISYDERIQRKINIRTFKASVKLYVFRKIKVLNIKIHRNYCEIFKVKVKLNILKKLKDDKQNGIIYVIKNIRKLKPNIKNIKVELNFSTESLMLTTFLVPTISSILSFYISQYMNENNNIDITKSNNCKLKINPEYLNINKFKLIANGQISFNTLKTLFFIKKHREIKV